VIGVDMTPAMAHQSARKCDHRHFTNVEFRLGEIEHLPVADQSRRRYYLQLVINLSRKVQVFQEAYRVLKRGDDWRSRIGASAPFLRRMRRESALLSSCVTGAALIDEWNTCCRRGFIAIRIQPKDESKTFIRSGTNTKIEDYLVSATIEAVK